MYLKSINEVKAAERHKIYQEDNDSSHITRSDHNLKWKEDNKSFLYTVLTHWI